MAGVDDAENTEALLCGVRRLSSSVSQASCRHEDCETIRTLQEKLSCTACCAAVPHLSCAADQTRFSVPSFQPSSGMVLQTESGMLIAGKRQQNRVPPEPVEGPMKMRPNASEIEGLISSISKGRFRKGPKGPLLIFDL